MKVLTSEKQHPLYRKQSVISCNLHNFLLSQILTSLVIVIHII